MPERAVAFVLAGGHVGGYGTLSMNRAKAAMPFAGVYRIIDFAISSLRNAHVEKIGIVIQYLPKSLIEHVGVGHSWDLFGHGRMMRIMPPFVGIGKTDWYRGTGDAIYRNLDFVRRWQPDAVIICSGDHVSHIDYADIVRFHREHDADITAVSKTLPAEQISPRFGRLVCEPDGLVVREFVEKPAEHSSNRISIGVFVFKTKVLRQLLENMQASKGHNLARHVVAPAPQSYRVLNYESPGYWNYLEDVVAYYQANMALLGPSPAIDLPGWEIVTNPEDRDQGYLPPIFMGKDSHVSDSLISAGCRLDGRVVRSVLSPGVIVEQGAIVEDSILMHDCRVGPNCHLQYIVSDKDALFEPNCHIGRQLGAQPPNGAPAVGAPAVGRPTLIGKGVRIDAKGRENGGAYAD
ncbi:glucose-1-phosphate adenylyltransferase family protein [Candidatus Sumerlaeota bacterium]